jgi:hypothetical protein
MPTEPAENPKWYCSILALLDRLRCCVSEHSCPLEALPPEHWNTASQARKEACLLLSQAEHLCYSARENLRQGTTPDKRWFEALHEATSRYEHFVAETKALPQAAPPEPPVKRSDAETKRSAAFLWRVCAEILATKVFRRLSSGILEPASGEPLVGMLERCETSADKVGDREQRMAISPTLEIARIMVVKLARQLIEEGCTEEQARQMLVVVERERERIRGAVVDAELEFAEVEPIIVEG